mgnify:CR=1 FL=1
MFKQNISWEVWGGEAGKYRLKDSNGNNIDEDPFDTCKRVAKALASVEQEEERWRKSFEKIFLQKLVVLPPCTDQGTSHYQ